MGALRTGLYPGTFDPITKGHADVIRRAAKIVDHLIVGVAINPGKEPMFTPEERVAMVQDDIAAFVNHGQKVEVRLFGNLLMHFAMDIGAAVIIRGLRAFSDFEYEFQMVGMNSRLNPAIETVFLMASDNHQFIASRLVKEIALLGGDIRPFVSASVAERIETRVAKILGKNAPKTIQTKS